MLLDLFQTYKLNPVSIKTSEKKKRKKKITAKNVSYPIMIKMIPTKHRARGHKAKNILHLCFLIDRYIVLYYNIIYSTSRLSIVCNTETSFIAHADRDETPLKKREG